MQHVTTTDQSEPALQHMIAAFDRDIHSRLDDHHFTDNAIPLNTTPYLDDVYDNPEPPSSSGTTPSDAEYGDMIEPDSKDADEHPDLDTFIHANLMLDVGGEQLHGRVIKLAREPDGSKKGRPHPNPLFDTRA